MEKLKICFTYDENLLLTGYGLVGSYESNESMIELELTQKEYDQLLEYPLVALRYDKENGTIVYDFEFYSEIAKKKNGISLYTEEDRLKTIENKINELEQIIKTLKE